MDFRREVERLLIQIPEGQVARCGDVARALGDTRASMAVFRFLRESPTLPGSSRVIAGTGTSAANARFFAGFESEEPLRKLREEQRATAAKVSSRDSFKRVRTIAGVDTSYEGDQGFATAVTLRASDMVVVDEASVAGPVEFPYIPTYLGQREFPLIRAALSRLTEPPTVLLVDGHGRIHPRRCGLACLVGVSLDLPTIGVAKNPMEGTRWTRPSGRKAEPVRLDGEVLGHAMCTSSTRPIFVSVGHRVSLRTGVRVVRSTCLSRNPEPLRRAHQLATEFRKKKRKKGFEEG